MYSVYYKYLYPFWSLQFLAKTWKIRRIVALSKQKAPEICQAQNYRRPKENQFFLLHPFLWVFDHQSRRKIETWFFAIRQLNNFEQVYPFSFSAFCVVNFLPPPLKVNSYKLEVDSSKKNKSRLKYPFNDLATPKSCFLPQPICTFGKEQDFVFGVFNLMLLFRIAKDLRTCKNRYWWPNWDRNLWQKI